MNLKVKKGILIGVGSLLISGIIVGINYSGKVDVTEVRSSSGALAIYLENDSGEYELSNTKKFPKDGYVLDTERTTCKNGGSVTQDATTKKISASFSSSDTCKLYFKKEASLSEKTLEILNVTPKTGTPTFANAATTDEGVYAMADDYGTSYYYRGAVNNNYVKFAGFWWRIIRVNGDGSLRIIYDGDQAYANGTNQAKRLALTNIAWNIEYNDDAKYVGYMYGGSDEIGSTKRIDLGQPGYEDSTNAIYNETDSNMKTQLEAWYKTNIVDKGYDNYVSDNIFCNDRSFESRNTGTGIGTGITTYYGARGRVGYDSGPVAPQFTCHSKNDAFTKSDTEKGNGKLSQKVGLITADEIVAAGSGKKYTENSSYYLYKGSRYWASSPDYYDGEFDFAFLFSVSNNGSLESDIGIEGFDVAPVINLSTEYVKTFTGDGTIGNEYRVE